MDFRFAIILALLVGLQTSAFATSGSKQAAAELVNQGNRKFRNGDFASALSSYEAAYRAYPSSKLFYNLATAHQALGHTVKAADYLDRFLSEDGPEKGTERAVAARKELDALAEKLAVITVESEHKGAEIRLNGAFVGRLPLRRLYLAPGPYDLKITMLGFAPYERSLMLRAGDSAKVPVVLIPGAPPVPPPPVELVRPDSPPDTADVRLLAVAKPESPDDAAITDKWWFWVLTAAGVAAVAASSYAIWDASQYDPPSSLGRSSADEWQPRSP